MENPGKYQPDKAIEMVLTTWYPVDSPLHLNPHQPCIKLAGECGELLDCYAKDEYKPNFSWWNCKHCGKYYPKDDLTQRVYKFKVCECNDYTPKVLDELGDISYYLRILAYQKGVTFELLCKDFMPETYKDDSMLLLLMSLGEDSFTVLDDFVSDGIIEIGHLQYCTYILLAILHKLDCSLSHLLELNYRKLDTESQNGWKDATIKS